MIRSIASRARLFVFASLVYCVCISGCKKAEELKTKPALAPLVAVGNINVHVKSSVGDIDGADVHVYEVDSGTIKNRQDLKTGNNGRCVPLNLKTIRYLIVAENGATRKVSVIDLGSSDISVEFDLTESLPVQTQLPGGPKSQVITSVVIGNGFKRDPLGNTNALEYTCASLDPAKPDAFDLILSAPAANISYWNIPTHQDGTTYVLMLVIHEPCPQCEAQYYVTIAPPGNPAPANVTVCP